MSIRDRYRRAQDHVGALIERAMRPDVASGGPSGYSDITPDGLRLYGGADRSPTSRYAGGRDGRRGVNPMTALGAGRMGNIGIDVGLHQDQYRHFAGYVYSIVRTIANRIAGQTLNHARKLPQGRTARKAYRPWKARLPEHLKSQHKGLRLYPTSPILDVFTRPNPIMTRHTMVYNTICSLELTGKAYWWMRFESEDEDGDGEPRAPQIWPLPAHWCEPVHSERRLFDRWRVWPGGGAESFELDSTEMCYFYYPDPADPLSAYSPLTALAKTVMADESVEESQRRSFLNAMAPGLAITVGQTPEAAAVGGGQTPPTLTRGQRRALKTVLMEEYRGTINNGLPLLLDGFIKDVKVLSTAPKEFDFLNSGTATKGRLSQGWGMNPISMGEVEGANRASSATADDHMVRNVVNPRLVMLSETMSARLPPFFTRRTDEVVYLEPAASQDIDYDLNLEDKMSAAGAMSVNERRERHGMGRVEGGDRALVGGQWVDVLPERTVTPDHPGGPGGVIRPGSPGRPGTRPPGKPGGQPPADPAGPHARSVRMPRNTVAASLGVKGVADANESILGDYERRFAAALSDTLKGLGEDAVSRAARLASARPPGAGVPSAAEVCRSIDRGHWERVVRATLEPLIHEATTAGAVQEWTLYGERSMHGYTERVGRTKSYLPAAVRSGVMRLVKRTAESPMFRRIVAGSVKVLGQAWKVAATAALAAGVGPPDPAAVTRSALATDTAVLKRAAEVAQTEAQTAVSGGQAAAYKTLAQSGVVTGRMWLSRRDERVRDTHREADGQIVRGQGAFTVAGHSCDYPGDPRLPPGERYGCRCVVVAVA